MSALLASLSYKEVMGLCASFRPSDFQVARAKASALRNEAELKRVEWERQRKVATDAARRARRQGEFSHFKGDTWREAFAASLHAAEQCRHFETLFARADRKAREWERLAARLAPTQIDGSAQGGAR